MKHEGLFFLLDISSLEKPDIEHAFIVFYFLTEIFLKKNHDLWNSFFVVYIISCNECPFFGRSEAIITFTKPNPISKVLCNEYLFERLSQQHYFHKNQIQ